MKRKAKFARRDPDQGPPSDSQCFHVFDGGACLAPSVATYAPNEKPSVYISVCQAHRNIYDISGRFTRTAQFKPREGTK